MTGVLWASLGGYVDIVRYLIHKGQKRLSFFGDKKVWDLVNYTKSHFETNFHTRFLPFLTLQEALTLYGNNNYFLI